MLVGSRTTMVAVTCCFGQTTTTDSMGAHLLRSYVESNTRSQQWQVDAHVARVSIHVDKQNWVVLCSIAIRANSECTFATLWTISIFIESRSDVAQG